MLGARWGTSARRRLNAEHAEFAERFLRERFEDSAASAPSALKPSLRPRHARRPPGYERAETIKRRARRVRGEVPSRTLGRLCGLSALGVKTVSAPSVCSAPAGVRARGDD